MSGILARHDADAYPTGRGATVLIVGSDLLLGTASLAPDRVRGVMCALALVLAYALFPIRWDRSGGPAFLRWDVRPAIFWMAKWVTFLCALVGFVLGCLGPHVVALGLPPYAWAYCLAVVAVDLGIVFGAAARTHQLDLFWLDDIPLAPGA